MMLFLHLLPGLFVLLIGFILYSKPPKRINWIWGFRTHYSMRDEKNWHEGNRYYAKFILAIGFISLPVGLVCYYTLPLLPSLLVPIGIMLLLFMLSIYVTNEHLKRKFGDY
ncbi:SdpI family protein [Pontibacter cellulosilyticus]|uniref:SdpI family protein n=1 Tax=Pontibacter cellulosilyticus TaxID=1720253 RepID=A0A923N6T5_9BACT|nr:SdpI family protein [Pontibacter cellulosilyticus]MBC5993291.1 SdpI family protein [Pontibacter cellulosilyticus]